MHSQHSDSRFVIMCIARPPSHPDKLILTKMYYWTFICIEISTIGEEVANDSYKDVQKPYCNEFFRLYTFLNMLVSLSVT